MTNEYTNEEVQEIVDQVNENVEEELYDDERCASYDDVNDLLQIVDFLRTKNKNLTDALKLVDTHFPKDVLSGQMASSYFASLITQCEDYDTYKELNNI